MQVIGNWTYVTYKKYESPLNSRFPLKIWVIGSGTYVACRIDLYESLLNSLLLVPGQQRLNIDYMISRDNTRLYEEPLPDKNECAFLHMNLLLIMSIELCYIKDVEYMTSIWFLIIYYWLCLLNYVTTSIWFPIWWYRYDFDSNCIYECICYDCLYAGFSPLSGVSYNSPTFFRSVGIV